MFNKGIIEGENLVTSIDKKSQEITAMNYSLIIISPQILPQTLRMDPVEFLPCSGR